MVNNSIMTAERKAWLECLKVGDEVNIVRRWGTDWNHKAMPVGIYTKTVVRRTPKRAYTELKSYIDISTGDICPKYLDYLTYAVKPGRSEP